MRRINDCIRDNSLTFEIYGECFSAADIYIMNQSTLKKVESLIERINVLEKRISPPHTIYRTIWVDRCSNGILYRASSLRPLKPIKGWLPLGYDGWYYQKRQFRTYYTQFVKNPWTRFTGLKYKVYNEDEFLKYTRYKGDDTIMKKNKISVADWYLQKLNR